jgi:hypothetical protein
MMDLLWFLGLHHPGFVDVVRIVIASLFGAFIALIVGHVRWWWIRRTRLPAMWKQARAEYENEIASLKTANEILQEKLHRAETAAFGETTISFRHAVNEEKQG